MRKNAVALAVGAVLLLGIVAYVAGQDEPPQEDSSDCPGVPLVPGDDIQEAIDSNPDGTTFCLAPGEFEVPANIEPRNGNRLIGAGMNKTFLVGTGAEIIIDARALPASSVVVAHMDISGSEGTRACRPACGSGFRGGVDNTIDSVRFHDHPNHGLGGAMGGLLVENSVLDHNGSPPFVGCCAGGIKGGSGFTIQDSRVFSNTGVGIWCDVGCRGGMEVYDNDVYDNTRDGIRYEISGGGAIIQGNVVENNNTSDATGGHGGITSVGSAHATISDNVLGGNGNGGIVVTQGTRGVPVEDIVIFDNELNGDSLRGCERAGVHCR